MALDRYRFFQDVKGSCSEQHLGAEGATDEVSRAEFLFVFVGMDV